jgi:hypothetical protein
MQDPQIYKAGTEYGIGTWWKVQTKVIVSAMQKLSPSVDNFSLQHG